MFKSALAVFLFCLLFSVSSLSAQSSSSKKFVTSDNVAINGYDVVAYFNQHEATKGSPRFEARYKGTNYRFASAENKKQFLASPEKFLPQYGGWCAFAMGMKNAPVPSNPTTFKLHDGKLYLFFNDLYEGKKFNTIVPWNGDEKNIMKKADANWAAMPR